MNGTGRKKFARVEVKLFHLDQAGLELCGLPEKGLKRRAGNLATACKRDVRVPRAKFGFEPSGERCFLDAFVDLKQVWMSGADTDPNDFGRTFRRERAGADDREEKGVELNGLELFAQNFFDCPLDVPKKSDSEMKLVASSPANYFQVRV